MFISRSCLWCVLFCLLGISVLKEASAAPVPKSLRPKPTPCDTCIEKRDSCEPETKLSFAQCFAENRNPSPGQISCLLREFDGRILSPDFGLDLDLVAYLIAECSAALSDPSHSDAFLIFTSERYLACSSAAATEYETCVNLNDCQSVCAKEGRDGDGQQRTTEYPSIESVPR